MSDDDDTPATASADAPKASGRWSEQDSRMLIITIGGTLAANLATVILVAAAIAFVRWDKARASVAFLIGTLVILASALGAIVLVRSSERDEKGASAVARLSVFGLVTVVFNVLLLIVLVLVWTGIAAGVK